MGTHCPGKTKKSLKQPLDLGDEILPREKSLLKENGLGYKPAGVKKKIEGAAEPLHRLSRELKKKNLNREKPRTNLFPKAWGGKPSEGNKKNLLQEKRGKESGDTQKVGPGNRRIL